MTVEEFVAQLRSFLDSISAEQWMYCVGGTVLSYLVGSISFAYIAGRLAGVDLRTKGSGNLGASNVFRVVGKLAGAGVFLLDLVKGVVPALAACVIVGPGGDLDPARLNAFVRPAIEFWRDHTIAPGVVGAWQHLAIAYGVAVICGHMFPFYLGFKGGKAVATGCGVFLVLAPLQTLTALLVWVIVLMLGRYVSLASMTAAVALFLQVLIYRRFSLDATTCFVGLVCLMVIFRHRSNIQRLLNGTENRIMQPERKRRPAPAERPARRPRKETRKQREARERLERLAAMMASVPNPARRQPVPQGYPGRRSLAAGYSRQR